MTNAERYKTIAAKQDAIRNTTLRIVESDPTAQIRLADGLDYTLKYTYGPVSRIFKQTGLNINLTAIDASHVGSPEVFEVLLREGLRLESPDAYKDPDLMDKVYMKHLSYYVACIQLALLPTEADPNELMKLLDEIEKDANPQQELPLVTASTSAGSGDGVSAVEFPPKM